MTFEIDFTPEIGPNYDILNRKVTWRVLGSEVAVANSSTAWETGFQFSFGNGYYGCLWFDSGSGSRDSVMYVATARLEDGIFVDGTIKSWDHTHFYTHFNAVTGRHRMSQYIPSTIWAAFPIFHRIEPGKVMVVLNINGLGASPRRLVTTVIVLSYDGSSDVTADFTEVFDTDDNPLGITGDVEGLVDNMHFCVPYKNGLFSRVLYVNDFARSVVGGQYIEYNNGVIAHDPYILFDTDNHTMNDSMWPFFAHGVQVGDKIVTALPFPSEGQHYLILSDENGVHETLDVANHFSTVTSFNWWGEDEFPVNKISNNRVVVGMLDISDYPYGFEYIEVEVGNNLTVVTTMKKMPHVTEWVTGHQGHLRERTSGAYGVYWQNSVFTGQDAFDYHELFGIGDHDEWDVFTVTLNDVPSGLEGVQRNYVIPFSWYFPPWGTYRAWQENAFVKFFIEDDMLICLSPGRMNNTDESLELFGNTSPGLILTGWTMPLVVEELAAIEPLRLIQRSSRQFPDPGSPRVGPNTYW